MAGFDEGQVFYNEQDYDFQQERPAHSPVEVKAKFEQFLRTRTTDRFCIGADGRHPLPAAAWEALLPSRKQLRVDVQDITAFDADLSNLLQDNPSEYLPLLEEAAVSLLRRLQPRGTEDEEEAGAAEIAGLQVLLCGSRQFGPASLRELTSENVSRLVMVPGIVTAASKPKHKATHITVMCKDCRSTKVLPCKPGIGGAMLPRYCDARSGNELPGQDRCSADSFVILPSKSKYVDQQMLKLQECPEDVPMGELPRSLQLVADRTLVGAIAPGTRVTAVGIYSIYQAAKEKGPRKDASAVALRMPYLRVVGMQEEAEGAHGTPDFTQEEEQEFREFAARPDAVANLFARIAPQIFGGEMIKQAVACLLFGGSRKRLPDGTWRRGDINVLLLGDPSTAKSQFLKFASKTAPIAVYTSGKGSSAAGLTASVIKDSHGEFYLEGGAMVLADNGVVCIDEFDKMRPEDRVAIHEAMEQQTISIAKAGITTMLKSRTSVLAAANPPSGRYDDLKSADENIDLQSTILSRFDLIFIVKDERNAERDMQIARHVLDVHRQATAAGEGDGEEARAEAFLKRYLEYARARVAPRLSAQAAQGLAGEYVELRQQARDAAKAGGSELPPVPITVRQLEAIVRIAESLARMQLQPEATQAHVRHAVDLFRVSTMDAVRSGLMDNLVLSEEQRAEMHGVEAQLKRRVAVGAAVAERRLVDELVRCGAPEPLVRRALHFLIQRGDFEAFRERRFVRRRA